MKRFIKRIGFAFVALLLLRVASGPTADLAYVLLIAYALRSRGHAIEALFLSFVFTSLNPAIFPSSSLAGILRYLIVLAAFYSVLGRDHQLQQLKIDYVSYMAMIFAIFALLHSFIFSFSPIISVLKVIVWALTFLTLLRAWRTIDDKVRSRVEFRIFSTLTLIVVSSLLLQVHTGAYIPRTELLRGAVNHSQLLGMISAILSIWAFIRILGRNRAFLFDIIIFGTSFVTLLATGARTGLLSVVIAIGLIIVLALAGFGKLNRRSLVGACSMRFLFLIAIGVGGLIAQPNAITGVLLKTQGYDFEREVGLMELYSQSRGGLASDMWENIAADPLVGIGFGIASNSEEMVSIYFAGIPISTPVEKGITLLAVWEELGLLGLIVFLCMLLIIFWRSIGAGADKVAIFLVILLLNMGEATLLSAGGAGMLQLVLLGWIISGSRVDPVPASLVGPFGRSQSRVSVKN